MMAHRSTAKLPSQSGFTLIEVLVAVVVLSIGLLGLAGMQSVGLRANQSAYMRSQAALMAYDIIDSMRANRTIAMGNSNNYDIALGTTPSSASTPVAANDVFNWRGNLSRALPSGTGSITHVTAGNTVTVTVTIQWDDSRAGGLGNQQLQIQTRI